MQPLAGVICAPMGTSVRCLSGDASSMEHLSDQTRGEINSARECPPWRDRTRASKHDAGSTRMDPAPVDVPPVPSPSPLSRDTRTKFGATTTISRPRTEIPFAIHPRQCIHPPRAACRPPASPAALPGEIHPKFGGADARTSPWCGEALPPLLLAPLQAQATQGGEIFPSAEAQIGMPGGEGAAPLCLISVPGGVGTSGHTSSPARVIGSLARGPAQEGAGG